MDGAISSFWPIWKIFIFGEMGDEKRFSLKNHKSLYKILSNTWIYYRICTDHETLTCQWTIFTWTTLSRFEGVFYDHRHSIQAADGSMQTTTCR